MFSNWKGTPSALRKMICDTTHSSVELLRRAVMIYTDENQNHVRKPRSLRPYEKDMRSPPPETSKIHVAYHISKQSAGYTGNTY